MTANQQGVVVVVIVLYTVGALSWLIITAIDYHIARSISSREVTRLARRVLWFPIWWIPLLAVFISFLADLARDIHRTKEEM